MDELFGHENLRVFKASVEFVAIGDSLLELVERDVAACDHLSRAMEGIPLHIAHANSSWSMKERSTYLGHANGSVLECAACLDVLMSKQMLQRNQIEPGKSLLSSICGMLIAMEKAVTDRVCEADDSQYVTKRDAFFSHERLDVYQVALEFVHWVDGVCRSIEGRRDLANRLDEASTGIVLNIAEGNGRFSPADHARFLGIAHSATVKSAATVDLLIARKLLSSCDVGDGRRLLVRINAMLTAMSKRYTRS